MPLQKLQFRPGVSRESTSLANEGGWFACNNIRFRSGQPEKLGGWSKDGGLTSSPLQPPAGAFWGVARTLWNWLTLAGYNLLSVGTHMKYYIQNGTFGTLYDVTPLRTTTAAGDVTFAATDGLSVIVVTDATHGASTGDFVTFSGAVSLGGTVTAAILNAEHQITYLTANTYSITVSVTANASDVGNGGASVVGAYQLSIGGEIYAPGAGWGAGGWGGVTSGFSDTGWGSASSAGTGLALQLRVWSQSNYGQDLIFNPRGGGLYYWAVDANPNTFNRGVLLAPTSSGIYQTDADCPSVCTHVLVSDASRFVLAFGVDDIGSATQDPMLVRWSAQEDYTTWTPAATNQAGSYRLSHGSEIITATQTRQEVLVWTDAALYSMQYLGPPYVWGFQLLGDNISIIGPNGAASVNNMTFWMGLDKFYVYSGRVETLPCTLWQYVFGDMNMDQRFQVVSGTNERYNEVWWFYCSSESTTVDRYVIYNYTEKAWYYGTMPRTAWLDSATRDYPMAAGYDGMLLYHEAAVDDGTTNPPSAIDSYIESADFDIGDGHNYGFVWRVIPDITFDGSAVTAPVVNFTVKPRHNPGAPYGASDNPTVISANNYATTRNYTVQQFTEIVYVRIRGRQMAFRVGSNTVGTQWQLGAPRIDVRPDGRR